MFVERCDRLSRLSSFDLNEMELILELLATQTAIMHLTHAIRNLVNCFLNPKNLKRKWRKNLISKSFRLHEILKLDF